MVDRRRIVESWEMKKDGDTIRVDILSDGSTKQTITGKISVVNHGLADSLVTLFARMLGGKIERMRLGDKHATHVNANDVRIEHKS